MLYILLLLNWEINHSYFIPEGKIPKGAIYLGKSESMEGDVKHTDTYYAVPSDEKPTVRTETVSSPKRYEDIGPIDQESGMPLSFRQVGFACGRLTQPLSHLVTTVMGEMSLKAET